MMEDAHNWHEITLTAERVEALRKRADQHKYHHGHAVVLGGGAGRTGAARLAGRAALRIGAGLVTLGVPGSAQMEVACQETAIMLRRVDDPCALESILADDRLNAFCIGPGFGVGERCRACVALICGANRSVVLDADALTSFSDDPEALFALVRNRPVVMTPHMGEFRRLFPDLAGADPRMACREAAMRAGCTILLKGSETSVADEDGILGVHNPDGKRAAPYLATAGSGDVLAGMICGLLARRFAPVAAAEIAAWLHAEAGRRIGAGLIAEDLPEALPAIFAEIGL